MRGARTALLTAAGLGFLGAVALYFGDARWRREVGLGREAMLARRRPPPVPRYDPAELAGLPEPVQRYFRAVLKPGQPILAAARLRQTGRFRMGEAEDSWRSFRADQLVTACPPAFDWDARLRALPCLRVYVHDGYGAGSGHLRASMLGLWTLADVHGTREVAEGELLRYLAEGAWMPTVLLPSQGVRWEAAGPDAARATLADRGVSVSLDFQFDAEGLITKIRAPSRPRAVKGGSVPTPWEGRFAGWQERQGLRIPMESEAAWILPEGPRPYFRGRTEEIHFEPAP